MVCCVSFRTLAGPVERNSELPDLSVLERVRLHVESRRSLDLCVPTARDSVFEFFPSAVVGVWLSVLEFCPSRKQRTASNPCGE